jgi:hypothetical protein
MSKNPPPSPPIVLIGEREVHAAFLLCRELGGDGRWSAWVMLCRPNTRLGG